MSKLIPQDAEFYNNLYKKVRPAICKMVGFGKENEEIVNDIMQDGIIIFMDKYQNDPLEAKKYNPSGLYYTICRNIFLGKLREENKIPKTDLQSFSETFKGEPIDINIEEEIIKLEKAKEINLCIQQLRERHRQVICLRYWDLLSIDKIAELLGYSNGHTVTQTIYRAILQLKDCFKKKQLI